MGTSIDDQKRRRKSPSDNQIQRYQIPQYSMPLVEGTMRNNSLQDYDNNTSLGIV